MSESVSAEQSVRQALAECLAPTELTSVRQIRVAYSGGLDSSVLLHALVRHRSLLPAKSEFPAINISAIHVHHGLSANADFWASHCEAQCRDYQINLDVERVHLADSPDGIEAAARSARYQVFERLCDDGDLLLMAHHADDQLETLMMRLTRGAGLHGLAGIPRQRALDASSDESPGSALILRPFLSLPRKTLEQYAIAAGLSWIEDESNQDSRYERNWWRNQLLPSIWERFPGRSQSMMGSAQRLSTDAEAMDWLLLPHLNECMGEQPWPCSGKRSLLLAPLRERPKSVQDQILRRWLAEQGVMLPSSDWLENLHAQVIDCSPDAQPKLAIGDRFVRRHDGALYLVDPFYSSVASFVDSPVGSEVQPSVLSSTDIRLPLIWRGGVLASNSCSNSLNVFDAGSIRLPSGYEIVAVGELKSSTARIKVKGRPTKSLKHIWQENRIPVWLRDDWPVLIREGRIIAMLGLSGWVAERESGLDELAWISAVDWRASV